MKLELYPEVGPSGETRPFMKLELYIFPHSSFGYLLSNSFMMKTNILFLNKTMKARLVFTLCCTLWDINIARGFSTRLSVAFNAKQEMLLPSTKLLTCISQISRKDTTQRANVRTSACVLSALNHDEEDSGKEEYDENDSNADEQESDISWLREAMSNDIPSELLSTAKDIYTSKVPKFESGLAGFAVDPELGFVSILLGEEARPDKFTFAIMSPTDINNVSSAEALCLVQLAGGLDLGAAVFPPEALARIVSEALEESDEDSEMLPFDNVEALRSRVSLLGVTAKKNENYSPNKLQESKKSKEYELSNQNAVAVSSAAREKAIQVSAPKILSAVKNLPGLGKVTIFDILEVLKLHSDYQGNLNREEFSQVLGTLRYRLSRTMINDQRVKFQITVSISSNSSTSKDTPGLKLMNIDDVPAFLAVALSLRYKVKISISNDCLSQEDHDQNNVMDRFPAFKPIQELEKDAQSISGSIASMFFKQSASDNDDKS